MPASPTINTFAGVAPPWSLTQLDANFTNIKTLLANLNNYANYYLDTGTANTYVITLTAGQTASLAAGLPFQVKIVNANTGACTLNANATGATNIKLTSGGDPGAGAMPAGGIALLQFDGTNYQLLNPSASSTFTAVSVRQTILSGPVDSAGLPNFGGSTGATTVTMAGTLIGTAANGFGSSGSVDSVGSGTNLSWTGLATNGTMYLYATISGGVLTTASTVVAPVYAWGGTPSVTTGTLTFNIQTMTGYLGNGVTAPQTNWVLVGEVTVAGAVVTAITWYGLMGRYVSAYTATLPGAGNQTTANHNLGITIGLDAQFQIECTSADSNYATGDMVTFLIGVGASVSASIGPTLTRTAIGITPGNNASFQLTNKTTGAQFNPTAANWKYRFVVWRKW